MLPDDWGSFHDEDGELLDRELLRRAAESVAQRRLLDDVDMLGDAVDIALTVGKALGRFCLRVEPSDSDGPSREAIEGVIELAVSALWISAAGRPMKDAERDYEHALRLTRSVLHAGLSDTRDRPGDASWMEWLPTLIGAASDVIDAACNWSCVTDCDCCAVGAEHYGTPSEQLQLAAGSLLTTCLQALALFDACA